MPESSKWSQAAYLMVAAAAGIVVMVAASKGCHNSATTADSKPARLAAPGPDSVASNWELKKKLEAAGGNSVSSTAPTITYKAGEFENAALALSYESEEEMTEKLDALMEQWIAQNPGAAAAWVKQLPDGEFRETAGTSLCQAWAAKDPAAAAAWMGQNLTGSKLQGALGAVASAWGQSDPLAVVDWVAGLKDDSDRKVGERALAGIWGASNPAIAADWLLQLPLDHQGTALQGLLTGWTATDPAAAAAWLQGALVDNPQLPTTSAAILVSSWVAKDPSAVSKWLNVLPEGPFYQTAALAFSQSAADSAPKDALMWGRSLADANSRKQAVSHVIDTWMENDWKGFVTALPKELEATSDPALREVIYDALYRKDPGFRDQMLKLVETPDTPGSQ